MLFAVSLSVAPLRGGENQTSSKKRETHHGAKNLMKADLPDLSERAHADGGRRRIGHGAKQGEGAHERKKGMNSRVPKIKPEGGETV